MTEIFHGGWNHQSVVIDPIYSTVAPKKNQTDQMEKKSKIIQWILPHYGAL